MTIDEAIAHAREVAEEKRKEMQCKTCKLFARSDLHPLQGYCRKNEFRSMEIDSWSKVCSEYVPKEMCKCAEEHEQLAEWLEELKELRICKEKMEMQYIGDVGNPLEPLKLESALKSEIMKYEFRKKNKPEDINILDYTVMYALKHCLEEFAGGVLE